MKDRVLAYTLFFIVSAAGIGLCIQLYITASKINASFMSYAEQDMETVGSLSSIKSYFSENERLIYEYYASPADRDDLRVKIAMVRASLMDVLEHVQDDFIDRQEYKVLAEVFHQFETRFIGINTLMDSGSSDSERVHNELVVLSSFGESINPALNSLLKLARNNATQKQLEVSRQLTEIVVLISVFTIIALLFFIIIGVLIQSMLKADAAQKKLAHFPERSPIAVFSLGMDGHIIFANPASYRIAALINPDLHNILPENIGDLIADLHTSRKSSAAQQYTLYNHVLSATLQLVPEFSQCHVYISDISSQVEAEKELHRLAYYDPVTGLPNSSLFAKDCRELIVNEDTRFSVMVFSFVRFELLARSAENPDINHLLKLAVERLMDSVANVKFRKSSRMYRMQGVSFALLIEADDNNLLETVTANVADMIQSVLTRPILFKRREFYLGPAIASCICPDDAITTESLLADASAALDQILKDHKPGYQPFDQKIRIQEQLWIETEKAIRKGIDNNEFLLFYQPKLSARGECLSGMEALVRWNHNGKMIAPIQFIQVAEESGLIIQLGAWILNEACRQAAEWLSSGAAGFAVAVNVSAIQFYQPDFVEKVEQALSRNKLPPQYLELEITESALMLDVEHNIDALTRLRNLGIELSLDDFGTGYSSLAYLRRLPISKLKIDRAFISTVQNGGTDQAIVYLMIEMAYALGLKVIAEGVETAEQVIMLDNLQCDELQGYHYSKPVAAPEMRIWLNSDRLHDINSTMFAVN